MSEVLVEIPHIKWPKQRGLNLDRGFRDVVADYLRRRWPTSTAKMTAREFDLTLERAREAVAGRVSLTTLEMIFKRGGFAVALPIVAEVIGQSIAHYIREMRRDHEEQARRLDAVFGAWVPLAADRSAGSTDDAGPLDRRGRTLPDRTSGGRR